MANEQRTLDETNDTVSESIALFKRILKAVGTEAAAIAVYESVSKDRRVAKMGLEKQEQAQRAVVMASTRQLNKLRFLGVNVEPGISKIEASKLIDEAVARAA